MRIPLKTGSVAEIVKKIKDKNYDINKCFIECDAYEDIREPSIPIFKYFLKVKGK